MRVLAANPSNDTGIDVAAGEEIDFVASGIWSDAGFRCGPNGYVPPPWLRIASPLLRCRRGGWFELCGAVGRGAGEAFPIGSRRTVAMPTAGRLRLFANDVPGFYRLNNTGELAVIVERRRIATR